MEFYIKQVFIPVKCNRFNSQRDGILQIEAKLTALQNSRFNSQRDGILRLATLKRYARGGSFNSQRDGILLRFFLVYDALFGVSIPNGMEFYTKLRRAKRYMPCFNSQRDGILR